MSAVLDQRLHSLRLVGLFCAITGCFLVYSLIQERLMTLGFGPQGERFRHSLFIILVNRLVAVAVAAAALSLAGRSLAPAAPLGLFAIPSAANVVGSASQYEALKYVSFPLQALAKCAKTVPVMAWGLLLGGRRYDAIDYVCALTVTCGCALFVLTGSIAAPQQLQAAAGGAAAAAAAASAAAAGGTSSGLAADGGGAWMAYGLLLLGAFLLCDGLTSTTQDRLFAQYEMHSVNQLLWVSAWSGALSLGGLALSGQLVAALGFVARHPSALAYILLLSGVSTAVQLFIFYTIQQYGALHFALIMTIRQFLSIVLSCLVFSHDLSPAQWLGTALVIGGLVARGMHRGSLDRTSAKGRASPLKRAASAAALLLPLVTIPIINQLESGTGQPLLAPGHKKDSARGDVFDVQASSLLRAEYGASGGPPADAGGSGRALRRSPSGGGGSATAGSAKAGAAFRRKALDMG